MRLRYYQSILTVFQLRLNLPSSELVFVIFSIAPCMNKLTELLIIAGADMATDNDIFILRDVFHRFSISHVFSRSVLPLT